MNTGLIRKFVKHLRTWEAGTVKTRKVTTSKLEDRGTLCMFVGYAINHDSRVYRMWNRETNRIIISRDVIWLKRMFFERPVPIADVIVAPTFTNEVWEGNDNEDIVDPSIDKSNDEDDDGSDSEKESEEDTDDKIETDDENVSANSANSENNNPKVYTTRSGRGSKAPTRLNEEMGQPKKITNEISNLTHAERNYLAHLVLMQGLNIDQNNNNEISCMALMKDEDDDDIFLVGIDNSFGNTMKQWYQRIKKNGIQL